MEIKRSQNLGQVSSNSNVSDAKQAQSMKNAYEGTANEAVKNKNGVNVNLSSKARERSEQFKAAFE